MRKSTLVALLIVSGTMAAASSVADASDGPRTRHASVSSNEVPGDSASSVDRPASLSKDGKLVAFTSSANNLVGHDVKGDQLDVFVRNFATGRTHLVSQTSNEVAGNAPSVMPAISANGRFVAFESMATNLVGHDNDVQDVFVRDLVLRRTYLVSQDSNELAGNEDSRAPAISASGRFITYQSAATNLVPHDNDSVTDIFLRDMKLGRTYLISQSSDEVGGSGNSFGPPAISANGRLVAFSSSANNLVPGDANALNDIFLRDVRGGSTSLVSSSTEEAWGNNSSTDPSISRSGRFIAFSSHASNFAPGDTSDSDIFVRDRQRGRTLMVSKSSNEVDGNDQSFSPAISGSGRFIAFQSQSSNLTGSDTDSTEDIFIRDRRFGRTYLGSQSSAGTPSDGASYGPGISRNGRFIAFFSTATNFAPVAPGSVLNVFRRGPLDFGI